MFRRKSTISSPRTKVDTVSLPIIRRQIHQFAIKGTCKSNVRSRMFQMLAFFYDAYQNALNFKNSKNRSSISSVFSGYCNFLPRGDIMKKILWSLEGTMCASSFCQSLAYPLHL